MTRPDDHVAFEELAAGHALSALEPDEEQRFLAHLSTCRRCERDVAEHAATLELLAYACEPAEPPPSVLQAIRAELPAAPAVPVTPAAVPTEAPSSLDEARRRRARRAATAARWTGVAAAAALVLGLGAWNLALQAARDDERAYGDRLAAAVRELASPGSRDVPLVEEDGSVVAVAVVRDDDVSLVVDGLPRNDSATTYVLWAQDPSGAVRPVGAFDVEQPQVDVVSDLQVDESAEVTAFLVSREPGDEMPAQPAGPVLASGEV